MPKYIKVEDTKNLYQFYTGLWSEQLISITLGMRYDEFCDYMKMNFKAQQYHGERLIFYGEENIKAASEWIESRHLMYKLLNK